MTGFGTHLVPTIEELDLRPIVTVTPVATLQAAAATMGAHAISSLVVGEPGEPVAILTERDVTRAVADGRDPATPVAELASDHPLTVAATDTVMDAVALMLREGVRHLVVTRGRRAVGVVSTRDLLIALVGTVTSETVLLMLQRVECPASENWLG
ncbi:MAG TPA: CBS domain-containing protein [Acidimicrobiales bacterium]